MKCMYVCFEEPIVSAKMPTPLVYPKITQSKSLDNDSPLALKCALGKLPFWCVGGIRDGLRNAVDFSLWVWLGACCVVIVISIGVRISLGINIPTSFHA